MTATEPAVPMTQAAAPMNEVQYAPAPPPPPPAPVAAPTPAAEASAFPVEAEANKPTDNRGTNARSRVTAQESAADQAPASATAAPRAFAAPAPAAPPPPQSTAKRAALAAQGMGVVGQGVSEGENDEPPATMNSPGARVAWLRRITELANQGRTVEARASLAEFRKRYPNERIPAALRALESDPAN